MSGLSRFARGAGRWLRQVAALVGKEWRQLLRDTALVGFVVFIFTLDILIAAGAPELDLRSAPIGLIDRDGSVASRELAGRLRAPYFDVRAVADDEAQVARQLERGQLRAVLTIPHDFERAFVRGETAQVQLVVEAADSNLGYLVASYTERILATLAAEYSLARTAVVLPEVQLQARYRFNPALTEAWYATISELLTMITVASILLPAAAMVREKERGTIEQLLVSPLSPLQIVLAKVVAMAGVVLVGSTVAVGLVMHGLLGVPFAGSPLLFFSLVALYAMTASGLGVVAATFARSSGQVGLIVLLLVMPITMLSGTWNLRESMPGWLQVAIDLSPLRYFVDITYGVLLKGADLAAVAKPAALMVMLGLAFLALGTARFRRQFR
ncbi:MAG: ABC transporter permease [Rhodocyclaceae bacterium]|nr:ABC transporter permease [Rhodocyclaceae bacterium]